MKRIPIALSLSMALIACQQSPPPNTLPRTEARSLRLNQTQSDDLTRPNYPAIKKTNAQGQVRLQGDQLTLSLELYPKSSEADFQTQLLDLSTATRLQATVTDSHGKSYTANGADVNGTVAYTGGTINLTFDNLVPDELLLVEVQAKNGLTNIVQADLATVLEHSTSSSPVNGTLNFQTTVAAKAIKGLLQNGHETRARAINLTGLHSLAERITGVSGTAPNLTYADVHPTLVNTALLATDLVATNPIGLAESDYRLNGATVNLNVSGLNGADKVQVQITDAASAVQTNLGNGNSTITNATPGTGLKVIASAFGSSAINYTYTVSPAGSISLTEGGTTNLTITAAPVLNVSGISPSSGEAGVSVVITGTGFTGTTAVNFNGTAASYTVDSNTQITATVPAGATDGPITVVNGASANSAGFNVFRRIYVNDDAGGANTGTTWDNAYTSLQSALAAARSGDEIWMAAGTYTPHASNRDVSFQLKSNVNIYGGFAGTETTLAARTASLTDFVTILSGDLSGNDNYTTPGSTLDENTKIIVIGANNTILEGVTVQGAKGEDSGGGMYNASSSPTLTNVTFSNNSAYLGGGMYNLFSSSPTLSNVTFSGNLAYLGGYGGGMHNASSSNPVLNNVTFSNNVASSNGLGGGMYNQISSSPILTNVTFSGNSATYDGGGMYNTVSSNPVLNNVTFSNNVAGFSGGGMYNASSSPILKNVLFWNSTLTGQTIDNAQGNFNLGTSVANDPFVNSASPNGADGIPRTADDGLRIKNLATANTIAGIAGGPAQDIINNDRPGAAGTGNTNAESGAYEYTP